MNFQEYTREIPKGGNLYVSHNLIDKENFFI